MDDQGNYTQQDIDNAINQTAAMAGMDPAHWRAVAQIESSLKPGSNYGLGTQYKGLFQIGTRDQPGAPSEWTRHGSGNVYNPYDNALAAAKLAADNNARFTAAYGRAPTPIETYMMHQQGLGFYTKGTMTNIAGNPYAKTMVAANETPQSFEAGWSKRLEDEAAKVGGQAGPYQASVAGTRGAGTGSASPTRAGTRIMPSLPATADASTAQPTDDTAAKANDLATQVKSLQDQYAQQDQANVGPQLQQMQFITPQMFRAQQLARVMQARNSGAIQPIAPLGTGTGTGTGTEPQ